MPNHLLAHTLFLISCKHNNQIYYLSNQSTLTNTIRLDKQLTYSKIANFLFKVQVESSYEETVPRRFYDPLLIKHHYSDKYLNFRQQKEELISQGFDLCLSQEKNKWTVLPCFKYQTKNTEHIQFSERILVSQPNYLDSSAKHLFIKQSGNQQNQMSVNMLFGYYYKSQIVLVKYHTIQQNTYYLGQYVQLYHQESYSFLVDSKPIQQIFNLSEQQPTKKSPVAFKNEQQNIGQTLIDCIWEVQEAIPIQGLVEINGTLRTNIQVRLKNVLTGNYLHLMDNSIDDQNYKMVGQQQESIYSVFLLQAVRSSQQGPIKDTQIRLKQSKIYQYMAVSKYRQSHALIEITMDKIPQDQHFYQFKPIKIEKQLNISFLLSLKAELQKISKQLSSKDVKRATLQWMRSTYLTLQYDLKIVEKDQSNLGFRKEQLKHFIPLVADIIRKLQCKLKLANINRPIVVQLIRHSYVLMFNIIEDNKSNQIIAFNFIHIFLGSIFQEVFAEEVITEMLKNNMMLLSKMTQVNTHLNCNLIEAIFSNITQEDKNEAYWRKIQKIIDLLYTVVKIHDNFIDINQRIVVLQLFGDKKLFDHLFFQIKIKKSSLFVSHPTTSLQMPVNNINEPAIELIRKTLSFISSLCEDRNIISKKLISSYLFNNAAKIEDTKMIVNCFYMRDSSLKSQMLLLLANLYVDSFPRITRFYPIAVIKMDLESIKFSQISSAENQMAELSSLLKESMMQKAEKSYYSRPLSSIKNMYDSQNANDKSQPAFTTNQINQFKKIIILLLETEEWSTQILRIVRMLLNLSVFSVREKVIIYNLVVDRLSFYSQNTVIVKQILLVLNYLLKYLQEQILQQVNIYLLLLNIQEKLKLDKKDIGLMISSGQQISFDFLRQNPRTKFAIIKYNDCSKKVNQYYQDKQKFGRLIEVFTGNSYDPQTTLQFVQNIISLYTPSLQTAKLLSTASIVSQNDLAQYFLLENYSLQVSNLTQISEEWLCSQQDLNSDHHKFLGLMTQLTNFLYQYYEFDSQQSANYKKNHKINKNRQIMIKNIGLYRYILTLLDSNYYLLQGHSLRTLSKKIRQTFQKCFEFLYYFCFQCEQNKEIMISQMKVVKHFINLVETGQTKLWILLVKNKKKLIQEIEYSDFQKLIFRIVKDRISFSYSNCDYDPLYLQQLLTLIDINGKPFKPNIDKIAKILQEPILFKKLLYLNQQKTMRNQFCLELYKIRFDPIQTPVIYQAKLIELLVYMIKQLGSKNSFLRRSLMSLISIDYIFYILSLEDSLTHEGIPPDMIFMLKIEMYKLLEIYLSIKEMDLEVYSSVELTRFLEYYQDAFTVTGRKKKPSMVDNEMLYYEYISPFEPLINHYLQNTKQYYDKHLKKIMHKLYQILEKVAEKEKDQNYQLISVLVDESKLIFTKQSKRKIEKQRDILIKWSNFIPSQTHPIHQQMAKNHLFQLLTNPATQQHLNNERKRFFQEIQIHEQSFMVRVTNFFISIESNFQDFHQQPTCNLVGMLHQYIIYKVSKQQDPFSTQKPKRKLSTSFTLLVIPLLSLLCIKTFDYNKIFCRKIYHYSFIIISTILSYQSTLKKHQQILSFLKDNPNAIVLLRSLNICLSEAKEEEKVESVIQQINEAQSQMRLIGQEQHIKPFLSSLKFIKELCRHSPFTSYFESQSNTSNSIDFVELIYTNLLIILSHGGQQLNIVAVQRIEYLCQTLVALFTGCNNHNQQVVANKQFIKYAQTFLKIDKLKLNELDSTELQRKIDQICSCYKSTIPQYKDLLIRQLNYFRFAHFAVVNCIKTQLVKVLLASTIANDASVQKLISHISIELLKLSLIILHQQILTQNQNLQERFFLQKFQDWRHTYEHQSEYNISMTLSAYTIALIKTLQGEMIQIENEQHDNDNGEQFANIQKFLPPNIRLLLKELKDQPFFRDIILFYQKYFQSYKFFKKYVNLIEVDLTGKGQIITVLFPRLPLCNKITEDFEYELEHQSNRLNQHQKSKSLFSFAQKFYEEIEGEIQFDQKLTYKLQSAKYLISIFSNSHRFVFLFWLLNIMISFLYLLCNYQRFAWVSLQQESFVVYEPSTFLRSTLLLFQIINLILCFILVAFMFVKKIPFYFYLHLKSFHQLEQKNRVGISKYQITHGLWKLFSSIGLDLFFISFSFLSIIHPIFSSFIILYVIIRFQTGKLLIKMLRSLFFQFMSLIGVLVVFNYLYAFFIYVNMTVGASYGGQCETLFVCIKLLMDQIIKGGFVTLLKNSYVNNVVSLRLFMEYSYNIIVPGVLMSIFKGVMFDKMSFLRERNQFIEKDERTKCFVCGQSQFQIDLNLEGYQKHLKQTHNRVSYISFLFYLKRKKKQKYLFYEHLVNDCLARSIYTWIPLQTSIQRKKKFPNQLLKQSSKLKVQHSLQQKHEQFKKCLFNTIRVKAQIKQIFDTQQENRLALESLLKETSAMKKPKSKLSAKLASPQK